MRLELFELLKRMIEIPSISGTEEALGMFLADYLTVAGLRVEIQSAEPRRPNIYAAIGSPDVVLSSHIDTVPPYVDYSEDDQYVYGRGACDAKGPIAAMIKAAEALIDSGMGDFGLLFVVGEEAGSVGARTANDIPNHCRYLVNGEPTESKLALGSKGALKFVIRAKGRAAHSAYPEMGDSAIDKLLDILRDMRAHGFPNDSRLGPTTMNIGGLKGGVAPNVIAPEADADIMFRVVTATSDLKQEILKIVGGRAEIDWLFECDPVFTESISGFDTSVVAFTTDIPVLNKWGKPLLFGPGSILDAHTPGERISKLELAHAVGSYANIVSRLKAGT